MKIKSLFLLGLSAAALASCGGVKEPNAYKNEVKKVDFLAKFEESVKDNILFHAFDEGKEPFSFVCEGEGSQSGLKVSLKNGKEYSKSTSESKDESSLKYDVANKVGEQVYEEKTVKKSDEEKSESVEKDHTFMKLDSGFFVQIDDLDKTIYKNEAPKENAEKELFQGVYYQIEYMIQSVTNQAAHADEEKTKFYIDGDAYTFVIEDKDVDEEMKYSSTSKYVYQIVLNGDSFEYFWKYDCVDSYETSREEEHSLNHAVISKKDVSVKAPDTSKYLDITPELK
ncbi:MAG: hypothetical protein KBS97_00185 [Firmicutes bacterium]|nr:hypothetical protein [Candidatus Fiminaster equi]